MMRWRIERDASGLPVRAIISSTVCPTCNDKPYFRHVMGARRPQPWPCPTCSNSTGPHEGVSPSSLRVLQ